MGNFVWIEELDGTLLVRNPVNYRVLRAFALGPFVAAWLFALVVTWVPRGFGEFLWFIVFGGAFLALLTLFIWWIAGVEELRFTPKEAQKTLKVFGVRLKTESVRPLGVEVVPDRIQWVGWAGLPRQLDFGGERLRISGPGEVEMAFGMGLNNATAKEVRARLLRSLHERESDEKDGVDSNAG